MKFLSSLFDIVLKIWNILVLYEFAFQTNSYRTICSAKQAEIIYFLPGAGMYKDSLSIFVFCK